MSETEYIVALPADLADAGWKLIERTPDRMFAVSQRWGGTVPSATIDTVIADARYMMRYLKWRDEREADARAIRIEL